MDYAANSLLGESRSNSAGLPPRGRHTDQADELLTDVAEVLRIDPKRHRLADTHARSVLDHILGWPAFRDRAPFHYLQGSFRLRTTVRPRRSGTDRDEYDVDLVIELGHGWPGPPDALLAELEKCLRAHPTLGRFVARRKRCICIDLHGELHIDVLPARPDRVRRANGHSTAIEVPDRSLHLWTPSDPNGFATWFEQRAIEGRMIFMERAGEPVLPPDTPGLLDTLRQMVQLTKRHRDVVFNGGDLAPRSITLTTLLAMHYRGEPSVTAALIGALRGIEAWLANADDVPRVANPVNQAENFADAWTPESVRRFRMFVTDLLSGLEELARTGRPSDARTILDRLFDERVGAQAFKRFQGRRATIETNGRYDRAKRLNIVLPAAPVASASARPIPRGTNYGSH